MFDFCFFYNFFGQSETKKILQDSRLSNICTNILPTYKTFLDALCPIGDEEDK